MVVIRIVSSLPPPQTLALASGMMEKLGEPGQYTLFAPTNRAFEKLGSGYLERIMGDQKIMSGTERRFLHNALNFGPMSHLWEVCLILLCAIKIG